MVRLQYLNFQHLLTVRNHDSCIAELMTINLVQVAFKLQNGSAHEVGASYSGLYEEGEVKHINCDIGLNYLALTASW